MIFQVFMNIKIKENDNFDNDKNSSYFNNNDNNKKKSNNSPFVLE